MAEKTPEQKRREKAINEIAQLGEKLENAMRAAVDSPKAREVQAEVVESVRKLGEHLAKAVSAAANVADSEQGRAVRAQVQKVLETGQKKGTEAAKALRSNLASGLKAVAKELTELGDKLQDKP